MRYNYYRRTPTTISASKTREDINYDLLQDLGKNPGLTENITQMTGLNPVVSIIQDPDNKFAFFVNLTNGEKIIAEKKSVWRTHWEFTYKGEKYSTAYTHIDKKYKEALYKDFVTPFHEVLDQMKRFDMYYQFTDDHRIWTTYNSINEDITRNLHLLTVKELEDIKYCFSSKERAEYFESRIDAIIKKKLSKI